MDTSRGKSRSGGWPLYAALGILALLVAAILLVSVRGNRGHLVYALDDTYIAMAMAKNLSQHGVWGVTQYEFSPSSSSLLWPILLGATYRVLGPNEAAPLVWNLLFAVLLILFCNWRMEGQGVAPLYRFATLLVIVVSTPLATLIFVGLEHTLHALLTVVVADQAAGELARSKTESPRALPLPLLGSIVLLVSARYEGLFLVGLIGMFFAARRRWLSAAAVAAAAALPVLIYGVIARAHGGAFLPNPILLKASPLAGLLFIRQNGLLSEAGLRALAGLLGLRAYEGLLEAPHLLFLLGLALLLYVSRTGRVERRWDPGQVLVALFAGTLLLHIQFARTGWLYRYEAYLVTFGLLTLSLALPEVLAGSPHRTRGHGPAGRIVAVAVLAAFPAIALGFRGVAATVRVTQAMRNIYEQQYQMGLFLRDYYQRATITAHDIGAINYLADLRCIDVWGLANREVFERKLNGSLDRAVISRLSAGSAIAVMYDGYLAPLGGAPPSWIKVGSWTIPHNVVCREDTVSFYAVDPAQADGLAANLRSFGRTMPDDVVQLGRPVARERITAP